MPPAILVVLGIIFLVGGAYVLVEGASRIAFAFGISELVVGLTIVAIGTSAPELAIVVAAALQISNETLATVAGSELIIGNVVGSNIANIGLILGFSSLTAVITVPQSIIRRDFIWLLAVTVLVGGFAWDGQFVAMEGVALLVGAVFFSLFQYRIAMQESHAAAEAREESGAAAPDRSPRVLGLNAGLIVIGGVSLALGSDWLVNGSTSIALDLGISEYLIGLTLVAVGTSLPELSTSIVASARGEGELVVGNIIGSNIYNLLLVLSAGMAITTLEIPDVIREVQIPLMIGLTFALFPILRTERNISRLEGGLLLLAYIGITILAFVAAPA